MGFSIVGRPEQWEKWVEEWNGARYAYLFILLV